MEVTIKAVDRYGNDVGIRIAGISETDVGCIEAIAVHDFGKYFSTMNELLNSGIKQFVLVIGSSEKTYPVPESKPAPGEIEPEPAHKAFQKARGPQFYEDAEV